MTVQAEYIGTYKIIDRIGEGGMAYIYKAIQPSLKRTVVIKKLKDPNREIIKRFKKEALLSASFHHENLVAIYDFIYANRNYYLVMEHVDGEDLHTIIDHLSPFPPQIAAIIALAIARGLEYTHARNIIHRDIKPSNILVSYDGNVKIIDFGIARDDLSTRLTLTGVIVGTPAYMSPEQANGSKLTSQSDIFSLGILLYEMLTGLKPFDGSNQSEILNKIIRGDFIPPGRINPAIPYRLRRIVKKCLQKSPRRRYRSATELINDLERYLPWQVRNQRKQILTRFLNQLNKNQAPSTQTILPAFVQRFSTTRWNFVKTAVVAMTLVGLFSFTRFLAMVHLGKVVVQMPPSQYRVALDGKRTFVVKGKRFQTERLTQGQHQMLVQDLNSSQQIDVRFNLKAGQILQLRLPPVATQVKPFLRVFSNPSGAQVFIDHQFLGNTPFFNDSLATGKHILTLKAPGYHSFATPVVLRPDRNEQLFLVLSKR